MWVYGGFAVLFFATGHAAGMLVASQFFLPGPPSLLPVRFGRALQKAEEMERAFRLSAKQDVPFRIREIDFSMGKLGSTVWPSSLALGQWLLDSSEAASAEVVLELGSGVGLVSLAAASSGAKRVFATDLQAASEVGGGPAGLIENIRHNAVVNGFAACIEARPLDWHLADSYLAPGTCDLVVGSDLVYYPENVEPLVRALRHHLAPGGTALLVGPIRARAAGARSASICDVAGLLPATQVRIEDWTLRQARTEVVELQLLRWSRPSSEVAV